MKKAAYELVAAAVLLSMPELAAAEANREGVPFELNGGHLIVVKGSIGSLQGLNLVIDTGASSVVVSRELAKKLKLKGQFKQVEAYGRKASVETVELPAVTIGLMRFEDAPAQIGELSMRGMDRRVRIDALIGLELIRRANLSIDFESQTIFFGPVVHSDSSFPFYGKLPVILVSVSVRGERVRLILDTGAEHLILYRRGAQGRIPMRETGENLRILYMGGDARLSGIRLSEVRMGQSHWDELPGYLLDDPNPNQHLDGVLGVACLGLKRLNLDFENNVVSWEMKTSAGSPHQRDQGF